MGQQYANGKIQHLDDGTFRIGNEIDSGNYFELKEDGEVNLKGNARVKKTICIGFEPDGTPPTKAVYGIYYFDAFTIGDNMCANISTPPDWDYDTDVIINILWGINEAYATNSGEVQWQMEWAETADGEDFANPAVSGTLKSGDINIPTNARSKITSTIGTIPAASLTRGKCLGLKLTRIAIDGGNNPTAEPSSAAIGIEYTSNKLGVAL